MSPTGERLACDRLLWRAGFGARPAELDRYAALGRAGTVAELLAPPTGAALEGARPTVEGAPLDPQNVWGHDVLWYLDRCVRARHPLVERMTFERHDHFAVSNAKVGNGALMLRYYRTLRRHALGSFRDLARAMVQDHAMQLFLDLANSSRAAPNENFARELLELFTLGAGGGYSERDVREAARALTGFTFEWDHRRFGFDLRAHDGGVKRVLGQTGRFGPLDVVDLAIARPRHAEFLCRKLWGYLSPQPCPPDLLRAMVSTYRASGTQLRPTLRLALTHPAFYANLDEPDQVKPPVVYVAGMLRRTGRGVDTDSWGWILDGMGQRPFYPPNVAGWDQDAAWLSTATVHGRFLAATHLLHDTLEDGSVPATETPEAALESARAATGDPWCSPQTEAALARYARESVRGRTQPWAWKHYFAERQRVLRHLLLAGPDAQVC